MPRAKPGKKVSKSSNKIHQTWGPPFSPSPVHVQEKGNFLPDVVDDLLDERCRRGGSVGGVDGRVALALEVAVRRRHPTRELVGGVMNFRFRLVRPRRWNPKNVLRGFTGSTRQLGQGISDQLTGKTGQKIFKKLTNQASFDR